MVTAGPAAALLATKMHVPRRRPTAVARPRLDRRLDGVVHVALTLVSAPAGFGKTTLVADWLGERPRGQSSAWVTLDRRDDDPVRFWAYVVAAMAGVVPGIADAVGDAPAAHEDLVVALVNELAAGDDDVILVLDDYHLVESGEVQRSVAFLLEHAPPQLHLVLLARSDPPLPLAGMRARGDLVEIRAADLRFSVDEAAAYLARAGLELSLADVGALESRTEGWIAALQLASLSLQGRDDPSGFIAGFAGDDRYVVDYLVGEVLADLPDQVRSFLLETAVLERLCGPLCEAVTGRGAGQQMLEELERRNLFVVPLDDRRVWYRYHHLFAEVLRARLADEQPEDLDDLHRRAADWHADDGRAAEAIHHALAGHDPERAADLVERAVPEMRRVRREETLRRWFEALPRDLFADRPVLAIGYVGALMASGRFDGVEALLDGVERYLVAPSPSAVVVDHTELARLPVQAAMYRAGLARIAGDDAETISRAHRVLELAAADDHLGRGAAAALMGLGHWGRGELDAAEHRYGEAIDSLDRSGHVVDVLGCSLGLADVQAARGDLAGAEATLRAGLDRVGGGVVRGVADLHVALAELRYERDDLDGARRHVAIALELGEHAALGQCAYRQRVVRARIHSAEGDPNTAIALLDDAERLFDSDFSPAVRPVAATRARVQLAHGDRAAGRRWVERRGLAAYDDLSYLREYEHLTLVRLLLAEGDRDSALGLLERLLAAAEAGGRAGSAVEAQALLALAHQADHDLAAAGAALESALERAEPLGLTRTFLDEGAPLARLLTEAVRRGVVTRPAARLLARMGDGSAPRPGDPGGLSVRELQVLRLLRSDLTGPEIAAELIVSLNTVRTHTRHIYDKLGVRSRRQAVTRADELGL